MNSTSTGPWNEELKTAREAANLAKSILLKHYGQLRHIQDKWQAGLVTEADRESEVAVRDFILSRFPDHRILGEEGGYFGGSADQKSVWIVDPLDGTTNYVHGFPMFCVSIGLQVDGEMVVGVVDAPVMQTCYHAVKGQGAFVNGDPIHVSNRAEIKDALLATGFAYSYKQNELKNQLDIVAELIPVVRGLRRAGSAALDLCLVAHGIFDGYWERSIKPWDTAAGSLIATEAGAVVTGYDGTPYRPELDHIIAANPAIHAVLLKSCQPAFPASPDGLSKNV